MKKILFVLLFGITTLGFSQLRMEGSVKDSLNNPLELANVILINKETSALESFAISDENGEYKLSLKKNTAYNLQISYIGMESISKLIQSNESNLKKDFTLFESNMLDAVELTYEMPVTVSGDTLIYNADSFKTGTERKLEDVLKNLPGVEVNDDGQIEVEGKVVGKVMVEGKDFFDGDTKIAIKNIPSNAIDKVQILKNYSEVGQLSGVQNNQDNIAINIKLKEGKDKFWFGNITAGGGESTVENLYLFQPKLFYYSPDYSINVIGDINNIGELAFTRRDYWNFSGGFNTPSNKSGTSINLGNNNLGFLQLQNNRAKDISSKFGAANFSYSPNKKMDLSGFIILTSSDIELQENNSTQYIDTELGIPNEETQSGTSQVSDLALSKFTLKYKPNSNKQLDYEILTRNSKENQNQYVFSDVLGSTLQNDDVDTYSINQNLNYYYTADANNIFAFEALHLISEEDPFYNASLENSDNYQNTAIGLGFDNTQSNFNIAQDKKIKTNQLDAKLDYWNILNIKSDINFTVGSILSNQNFDSNIFQFLDNGDIFESTPTINNGLDSNRVSYNFKDYYVGMHYRLKTGIFTLSPGFTVHAYNSSNEQNSIPGGWGAAATSLFSNSFYKILPDFNARIQLKKSESLTFNYAMRTQFTDISKIAEGLVLNSYNSIFSGNNEIQNAISHNLNLNYFSFNLFNYTNVYARLSYNKSIDQIRNLTTFESVVATSSPFNSAFADENLSANARFQRQFGKLRASLKGGFNYSKFNQFIQSSETPSLSESYSQSYGATIRTSFKQAPNVELGYNYSFSENILGSINSTTNTKAPFIDIDALILKSFTFRTKYTNNTFSDDRGGLNKYEFWNASLAYKKDQDSKWEFELKATNLLDTKSQNQSNTGNISISTTEYFIQPRFITFRLVYDL
ncbi:MAG: carboxypeptidase-like regulatory domain-containing protein [Flavobacteriaceae bacterium]|nr:carboxypeptidase-like regulatory domain-containing protein [Flavobacteriaceae bacterium]